MNNRAVKNTASLAMLGGTLLVFFGATFFLISSNLLVDENDDNFKNDISSFEIPTSIVTELGIQKVVHDYLKETIAISSFGDEVFCSFEVLGSDQKEDRLNLYLWTLCSELYLAEGKIIEGAGVSEPVVIALEKKHGEYMIVEHKEPQSGSLYIQSVQDIFPAEYHEQLVPDKLSVTEYNDRNKILSHWVNEQGKEFYGLE